VEQRQSQQEQLQKTKVEIKNVIPFDLYETMVLAGRIATDLRKSETPPERHLRDFYGNFYALFSFTQARVSEKLATIICSWFGVIRLGGDSPEMMAAGVDLFQFFYNEMTELGVGQMFENPIEPPIAWEVEEALLMGIDEIEKGTGHGAA
jgi:hypothetical protein